MQIGRDGCLLVKKQQVYSSLSLDLFFLVVWCTPGDVLNRRQMGLPSAVPVKRVFLGGFRRAPPP